MKAFIGGAAHGQGSRDLLTGQLGGGKTTLLNRMLPEKIWKTTEAAANLGYSVCSWRLRFSCNACRRRLVLQAKEGAIMQRRSFMVLAGSGLVCGCGAVHQLPAVSDGNIAMAQAEVRMAPPPQRRRVSDEEAAVTLRTAIHLVRGVATNLCHEMNVGVCDWRFRMSRDRNLNAGAMGFGNIMLNRGIVEYAANEEEVCLVVAHEIGHHAANHVARATSNQMIGALIGVAVAGVVAAATGSHPGRDATQSAAQLGASIGRLSFSKEQEREADYMAALILYRAGIDLDRARGLLVSMARGSGRMASTFLDSHPAGPERVAAWDRAVAEIRASNGRLPQRAS